jgi:single-strand DNA-binding protein
LRKTKLLNAFICGGKSMNSLNQIIIEGNVVKTPEKKELNQGMRICMIPLAVNRRYKTKDGSEADEVSYFDVETYGNLADVCSQWCPKGRGVRVVGRLKQQRWKTKTGESKAKVTIIAEHVEFKPFYKKNSEENGNDFSDRKGPSSADMNNTSDSKKKKLAMLQEAASQAQYEQEAGEVVF